MLTADSYSSRLHCYLGRLGICAALMPALGAFAAGVSPALAQDVVEEPVSPEAPVTFDMVRSASAVAGNCLVGAGATVSIVKLAQAERMTIVAHDLPANTDFVVFVIQKPSAPFGLSWYQGDLVSDADGNARVQFVGRFNIESFIVAPGVTSAPRVHRRPPFPDAGSNPTTPPVHTFNLGIWFDSTAGAAAAGCPDTVTPFNGDHTAGIQALSTRGIAPPRGPLSQVP